MKAGWKNIGKSWVLLEYYYTCKSSLHLEKNCGQNGEISSLKKKVLQSMCKAVPYLLVISTQEKVCHGQ